MVEIGVGVADGASPEPDDVFSRVWAAYEAGDLIPACAWCERVRIDDRWLVAPRAALAAIDTRNVLSHSMCDECSQVGLRTYAQGGTR
ncbi:MAG: hypothetical protein ACXVRJ_14155 [Gaiellaceae bacterium]